MPYLDFPDGTSTYIKDTKPETIAKAKADHAAAVEAMTKGEASVLGDVGRQAVRGLQDIGRGGLTTLSSVYDYFTDEDLTKDINEYYDSISPGEAETTAGEITKYLVQFGLPGFGAAGVLARTGKVGKLGQAIGAGVVDGAVATDDIQTLQDIFLDSESDETRLARLQGAEAASERLKDKLQVATEGAGFILGLPLVAKAAINTTGALVDLAAPVGSFMAKTIQSSRGATKPGELQKTAFEANTGMYNWLKKNFSYVGARPGKEVAEVMGAKVAMVKANQDAVDGAFDQVINTVGRSVDNGLINQDTALSLSRSIEDFMFPTIRVDYMEPGLKRAEKIKRAKAIQAAAEDNIKSIENNFIDYQSLGLDDGLKISNILKTNRDVFDTYSQQVLNYSDEGADGFMHLFLPQELRDAIAENVGTYGTRVYKSIIDKGYKVNPEFQEAAITKIQSEFGLSRDEAQREFFGLLNPGPKNKNAFNFDTNQMYLQGLNADKGILKGRQLDNLPQVRMALGEAAGYLETDWRRALNNTKLTASLTSQRLSNLIGKTEMFNNIKRLDDISTQTGGVKFLKPKEFGIDAEGKQLKELVDYDAQGNQIIFKQFDEDAGALAGTYAREDVWNALLDATADTKAQWPILGQLYTGFLAVKAGSQYGKTVLSPGAQIRNFTSIPFFSLLNGNLGSTGKFTDAVQNTFAGLINPKTRQLRREKINELIEEGIQQKGGAQLGETLELAKLASERSGFVSQLGKVADKSGIRFFEKAYGMTDDAGRTFNYYNEKDRLRNALLKDTTGLVPIESGKNMLRFADIIETSPSGKASLRTQDILDKYGEEGLEQFIRSESAEITLNTVQNYQRVVPFVSSVIRRAPIGNFVAFPAEIMRNTYNALGRSIKELASDNKEIQKIGMRRLTGAVATTTALPIGLYKLGTALTGTTDEKVDAYKRSFAAPWDSTATLIPIATDKDGNPTQFINFSYMNPYDYLRRPVERVFQEVASGNRDEESLSKILFDSSFGMVGEMFQPFVEPAFSAQALLEGYAGETATGRKIWGKADSDSEKFLKSTLHFIDTALPTITPFRVQQDITGKGVLGVGLETKNFPKAVIGSTNKQGDNAKILDRAGKEIDVAETLVQAFSGLKVVKPQIDRTLRYRGFEANDAIKDATNQFNRLLRSSDKQTAEQFIQGYINSNEKRYRVLRDLYTAIEDARTLGMSERDIEKQLKDTKVANYRDVMRGIFRPIDVSRELATAAETGALTGVAQPVSKGMLDYTKEELSQGLTGQYITPDIRAERARQALREEEERKLLGTP